MLTKLLLLLTTISTCHPCRYSDAGYTLTEHFEGFSPFVYEDVAGKKTIGFGHLIRPGERFDEPMTPDEAEALLDEDVQSAVSGVNRLVSPPLKQGQFDALVDFSFNLGVGALAGSTALKKVNAGKHAEVPCQLMQWNKARVNGVLQPLVNLTRRRESEGEFYAQ
jgi:lysozyme